MAIQNLRSSSAHKRPIPNVLSAGQIAVNTNQASPGLFFKDSNGDLVKVGPVHIGTAAPNSSPATTAADALVSGTVYQILTLGNTDFTAVGASANTVGVVFTATGAGTGTGTVSGQQGNEKGEQWLDTTGGAYDLKIYDGSAWRSQAGEFVNVTGDNMTGNLTLGSTNIVLNASNGNITSVGTATFASTVTSGSTTGRGQFLGTCPNSVVAASADAFVASYDGSAAAQIKYDGSAEFAGTVTVDGGVTNENAIYGPGYQINTRSAAARNVFTGQLNGATTSTILADGSATFAGGDGVTANQSFGIDQFGRLNIREDASNPTDVFSIYKIGTKNVGIKNDGSATFKGAVTGDRTSATARAFSAFLNGSEKTRIQADGSIFIGGNSSSAPIHLSNSGSATFAGGQTIVNSTGWIDITRTTASSNGLLINQQIGGGTKVNTISLLSDGSATFAGNVVFGGYSTSATNTNGARITSSGQLNLQRQAGALTDNRFQVLDGQTVKAAIQNDGSATFRSTVSSGASDRRGQFNAQCPSSVVASSAGCFVAGYNGSTVINMRYDGSAEFAGSITSQNTILSNRTGSTQTAFQATLSGATKVNITAGGAATFAGDLLCGTDAGVNIPGVKLDNIGAVYSLRSAGSSAVIFQGGVVGSGANVQLKANGSATFKAPSGSGVEVQTVGGNEGTKFPFLGRNTSGSATFSVNGDGTIGAAGNLVLGTGGTAMSQIYPVGSTAILHLSGGGSGAGNMNFYSSTHASLPKTITFQTNSTERLRIASNGYLYVGNQTAVNPAAGATAGLTIRPDPLINIAANNNSCLTIGRNGNDGALVVFYQAGSVEGNISVSGTTVSYNGAHLARWSQLASGAERIEILRGSVLSNIDEMCEWGEEENEQLNRTKVSDVEGDRNVAGVFQGWDDDDDTYTNDFYCAMTGDFVIRIAQGTTVARGDLLMSAGDGTAKPQDDDIVRSKTIAKVTSTTVSTTYEDGSYCVPCVLMAC